MAPCTSPTLATSSEGNNVFTDDEFAELRGEFAELRGDFHSLLPKLVTANIASMIGMAGLVLAAASLVR